MHSSIALVALLAAGSAVAKTIQIDVGKGGLVFSPDTSTASVGDTLEFHFYSAFHTVVQSDFSKPCQRSSVAGSGFNSGPINNKADGTPNVFQVSVKDLNPIWFYCSTPSHCQSGMAGVVNPPSSGNTLATYKSNAAGTSSSEASSSVAGGQVVAVGTVPSGTSGGSGPSASSGVPSVSSSAAPVSSSSSAPASSAAPASSSAASAATSAAGSTVTSASGTVMGSGLSATATTGTAASTSTSAKATPLTTSGAVGNGLRGLAGFAAQGTVAGLAVGVGLLVFFMA